MANVHGKDRPAECLFYANHVHNWMLVPNVGIINSESKVAGVLQ